MAVARGASASGSGTVAQQCRFEGWDAVASGSVINDNQWGGIQKGIAFFSSQYSVCSTTPDSDAATYYKQKIRGPFEFSFTYDDGAGAVGGINRFMAGFWATSSPQEFQSIDPENNADGPRYFFSTETNSVYYSTNPGRNLERHFSTAIFQKGARMTCSLSLRVDVPR